MFGSKNTVTTHDRAVGHDAVARGGLSFGSILTGALVALGVMALLTVIVGAILTSLGLADTNVTTGDAMDAGLAAGIALIVAQFLSYLWGGYTAGRMARGAGVANGLLVPLVAILLVAAVAAIAWALGSQANLNLPFTQYELPGDDNTVINWGIGIGIATLVAMFLGGALGGALGHRWHTKLERRSYDEHLAHDHDDHDDHDHVHRGDTIDLRDRDAARHPQAVGTGATTAGYAGGAAGSHLGSNRGTDVDGDGYADRPATGSGYATGTDRDGDGYADRPATGSAYTAGTQDDDRRIH